MPQENPTGENTPDTKQGTEQQRRRRGRPRGRSQRPAEQRPSSGQPRSPEQRSPEQRSAGDQQPRSGGRRRGQGQNQNQNQNQGQPRNPNQRSSNDRRRSSRPRQATDQQAAGASQTPNADGNKPQQPRGNRPPNSGQRRGGGNAAQQRAGGNAAPQRQKTRQNPRASGRPGAQQNGRRPNRRSGVQPGWGSDRELYVPSVPLKARGGIKARNSEGGEFGKNWWAKRWLLAMERLMDGARLQRGRRYARMGQVLSMNEVEGAVVAKVQGSRPQPYKVTIQVEPFSDEQWEKVLDVLADQAIFTAQLLAGEMPDNIEDTFADAGISLFPARGGELMTECSCPDWANPCKHIAATHYILGDRFDEDPFLIFRLRGRTQEQILQALRQRRAGLGEPEAAVEEEPQEEAAPLDGDLAHFWDIGPGLENFAVNVQRPAIALPLLKRLGEPDIARKYPLEDQLGPALEAISQAALILAYSDMAQAPSENGSEGS